MPRLALLLLLCVSALAPVAGAAEPTKLAVMYFESSASDPKLDMLRLGLAQMLITDLSGSGRYDVVERSRLNELLAELELQRTDAVDPDTAVKAGKLVGAHYMVLGSYFELMGTLRVDARVVDVETGQLVSVGATGTTATFLDLEKQVAKALEGAIADAEARRVERGGAARPDKGEAPPRTRGAPTESPAPASEPTPASPLPTPAPTPAPTQAADPLGAALAFSEGLDLLDRKDLARARARFERALELDPQLADARAELAALPI
jgi:TolB-like protein